MKGALVEAVRFDRTGMADGEPVTLTLSGFVDPSENQGGPGLALIAVDASGEADGGAVVTAGGDGPVGAPLSLSLDAPSPNPSRGQARVTFRVPTTGRVRLAVHDALGREVAVLVNGDLPPGDHTVPLATAPLAPGAYLVRLAAAGDDAVRRFTVIR